MNRKDVLLCRNKSATFHYTLGDKICCGMKLEGWEVKSIRDHRISLTGSYVSIVNGEVWLKESIINPVHYVGIQADDIMIRRPRKLLLQKRQILKLHTEVKKTGNTLIPLDVKTVGLWIKCTIALAKGKSRYDKRTVLKEQAIKRDMEKSYKRI